MVNQSAWLASLGYGRYYPELPGRTCWLGATLGATPPAGRELPCVASLPRWQGLAPSLQTESYPGCPLPAGRELPCVASLPYWQGTAPPSPLAGGCSLQPPPAGRGCSIPSLAGSCPGCPLPPLAGGCPVCPPFPLLVIVGWLSPLPLHLPPLAPPPPQLRISPHQISHRRSWLVWRLPYSPTP